MKKNLRIIISISWIFIAISFILSIIFYLYRFHSGISENHEAFSQFGSYFGGVLTPILTFAGFLILLETFKLQKKETISSERQLEIAKNESKKKDIFDVLKDIDSKLEKLDQDTITKQIQFSTKDRYNLFLSLYEFLERLYFIDSRSIIFHYYTTKYIDDIHALMESIDHKSDMKDMKETLIDIHIELDKKIITFYKDDDKDFEKK